MRIPSQFNDSSLYRPRRGDKNARKQLLVPERRATRRRLIRLGVALLLVVVVMREARQPGLYQTFFGDQKDGWVSVDKAENATLVKIPASTPSQEADSVGGDASRDDPWESAAVWVDRMELELQRSWIESLSRIKSAGQSSGDNQDDDREEDSRLWIGLSEDQLSESIKLLSSDALAGQGGEDSLPAVIQAVENLATISGQDDSIPTGLWSEIAWWANPTVDALDQAALSRVTDGTFWMGDDSDAFYLQLSNVNELDDDGAATTGTLPLLQQPDVYRGQRIRIVGTLQLVEARSAKNNRVGIHRYWKMWVIPADGGIRPTVLITHELPDVIANSLTDDGTWDRTANASNPDGQIVAVGRFIKRLPYRSSIGADLAPVVIGRIVATQGAVANSKQDSAANSPAGDAAMTQGNGWIGILLAVVVGIALAVALMYRSSVDAKRSRAIRKLATQGNTLDVATLSDVLSDAMDQPTGGNEEELS